MVQRGANLIGVCDSEGGIYNSKGKVSFFLFKSL